jgi:plastocyanin
MRTTWLVLPALVAGIGLAGCGGDDSSSSGASSSGSSGKSSESSSSSSSSSSGGSKLALAADPGGKLAFDKPTLSAKAGKVTIAFTNSSGLPHAVEVEGHGVEKETKTITDGNATLTAKLKPGTYEFYCPVDGHRQAGMEGKLTVK